MAWGLLRYGLTPGLEEHMRARRELAILLLLALVAACQRSPAPARVEVPADSAAGEIPFELAGPGEGAAIVVPVFINGQGPFDFVLDTGATLTCLDQELAQRLELREARGVIGSGAGVGGAGQMRILRIDSLRVGAARATEMMVCAVDLQHVGTLGLDIDGLLGLNFLREFRIALDFQREVLLLQAVE
jgi:predicted aspartyl protease